MLIRTVLALLLLLPAAASAQELDTAVTALVRISGTRGGTPVRGTGFVVGLDSDKATIVTASHVIEGVQQLEATFAVDSTASFPAGVILGMDAGSPNGLAVFQVRGALPAGVTTLSFEAERPHIGEALFLLGFPNMELSPRTAQRVLSARRGTLLLIDQGIGEGFSGGPVLKGGKVVGVVTDTDSQTTYAVNAAVVREALDGWGVRLSGSSSTPVASATIKAPAGPPTARRPNTVAERQKMGTATQTKPQPPVNCVPGKESTESGIVFVRICAGTFTMGSAANDPKADADEKPAHQVTLSEFWIGKTEITNEQYRRFRPDHMGEDSLPVTGVSLDDAKAACEYFGGRLPTEAEWEYAARAGSQTAWSFGADEKKLGEYAWYAENSGNTPHPVGTKKPNPWGLYDMHGNVWEWVADWYGSYSNRARTDPSGPTSGKYRVLRGGAFDNYFAPGILRSALRLWYAPSGSGAEVGFRCASSPRRQS